MGRALTRRRERRRAPGNAGVLLPVSALSEEGVLLRTDGAVVRYLEVLPPNPLVLDPSGCERLTAGFSAVLSRLAAGQGAQFYVEARPLAFETVRDAYLEDVERALGALEATAAARDSVRALGRLSETHVESLEHHAADHAAVDLRYVVVLPYRPVAQRWAARARPAGWDASAGHLHAATQSLALADAVRSELEALDVGASLMDGRQVAALIARALLRRGVGPAGSGSAAGGSAETVTEPRRRIRRGDACAPPCAPPCSTRATAAGSRSAVT